MCITLHEGTQYRTPEDNAAASTAFADGLRRRVAAAGTPGPATPAVSVETVPAWRPDVSGRRVRVILCLVPYFAILITLGVTAGGGHTVELTLAGCLSLLSFLSLSFFADTTRDRYHLRKRGVTVRVPIRSGRVSNRRYRVWSQRFTTVDGRTVTAGVPLHAPQTTAVGDLVDVRYDP
ncbi:hypothetical protein ACFZBU_35545 [Embleya sp. NPDC008237]|uniref:hypothetical protein n=1 Tax=Embleya sp. NPDC008237 TaxID=3363978 RepID=UPI0036EED2C5